ncbi:response regulator [Dokdonella soli]|uniref:Response regulatory domain-containing protein n=1 Tax=Dokdonella soli TaxID=529810 RepID=A0ABN1ISF1_9GAMM
MRKYPVAGCALKERDQRLLQMLMSLPAASRFQFLADKSAFTQPPSIAIVDTGSPLSLSIYEDLKKRFARTVPVAIIDPEGAKGDWLYTVQRASLLRSIFKVLDSIVDSELWDGKSDARTSHGPETSAASLVQSVDRPANDAAFVEGSSGIPEPLKAIVVDDSLAVREQLRAALDRMGFRCDQAADADQAQAMLALATYDIALLDVVMPGMDGYELCRKIKQDPNKRSMPVVMLTSRSSPFDRARGMLSGCNSYLTKPITWDEFRTAIDKALLRNSRNTRAQLASRGYAGSGQ